MKTATTTTKAAATQPQEENATRPAPVNPLTRKEYFGTNAATLSKAVTSKGFDSLDFATMKQWNKLHRSIALGEKATRITRYERIETDDGVEYSPVDVFVFNRQQLAPVKQAEPKA